MSYRNDHDAALNRVAALESELARLRGEQEDKVVADEVEPDTGGEKELMKVLVGGAATILVVLGLMWRVTHPSEAVVDGVDDGSAKVALIAPGETMDDEACMAAIEERAVSDARDADPRSSMRRSVAELMRAPVLCRGGNASSEQVENVSSLITVYYESDPVTADGYQSAEQLWREYHRARAGR